MNFGVFGGILTGLITAMLYNRFSEIRLHPALGFFSGRRFVPIVTLFAMIGVSFGMAII
jgi:phosphotransferase system  glucose/maltose/N-acetylglucosamine-specific IIC component